MPCSAVSETLHGCATSFYASPCQVAVSPANSRETMFAIPRIVANAANVNMSSMRVVVVFLPGIMGTRLVLPDRDWDPDSTTTMLSWGHMTPLAIKKNLALSNETTLYTEAAGLSSDEEERGWGQVSQKIYGSFLKSLQAGLQRPAAGVEGEVWVAGYDWRQPNPKSSGRVLKRIKEIQNKRRPDRTIVVTHSMGGLVSRHLTRSKESSALIEAVIHIGQPVTGAVVAYRRLLGGAPRKVDGLAMSLLLGANPEDVATTVSGLPSYFELLPTDEYRHSTNPADFWLRERDGGTEFVVTPGADETIYDLYLRDRWPPSAAPRNLDDELRSEIQKRIVSARKIHSSLAGDPATGTPPKRHKATWSLLSSKEMTDTTLLAEHRGGKKRPKVHFSDGRTHAGDGTVPAASAGALFPGEGGPLNLTPDPLLSRQFFVDGLVHDVMCEDPDLQQGVLQLLLAILSPATVNLSGAGTGASGVGRITFDANVIWDKLHEAQVPGTKGKEAAAEIRVAKYFAQHGRDVHLIQRDPGGGRSPDMRVSGMGNIEVKRLVNFDPVKTKARLKHAVGQVKFKGKGIGFVVIVYSVDSGMGLEAYRSLMQSAFEDVRNELGSAAFGIRELVLSEDKLPPAF